jgi:small subunit ribosomal protein S9
MSEIAQYLGTGKRKTSVARVILRPGDGKTWINGRTSTSTFRAPCIARWCSRRSRSPRRRRTTCACACRKADRRPGRSDPAGIARALVEADPESESRLRQGF